MDDYDIVGDEEDLLDALSLEGDDFDDDLEGGIGDEYEIVGNDFSGDGTTEIVGARRRSRKNIRRALAKKIAAKKAVLVERGKLRNKRRMPLGFVPTSVAAAATPTITTPPQNLFRTERLVIPSDIAFSFGIVDFKVGNESQFVAGGEVPAAMFTEVAIDTDVSFKTAEVGNQISINVRNKSAGTLEFVGGMIGTTVR